MRTIITVCITILLFTTPAAFADEGPPSPTETGWTTLAAAGDNDIGEESVVESEPDKEAPTMEKVLVSAQRLPGEPLELSRIPMNATVITAEEIERSSARTVPEILKRETGFVIFDQIGNGKQQVVDVRGFSEGTATALFVDGVRVNEPSNNFATYELLPPLEDIERIEVIRGGASTIYGEGAFAGVVNVITKKGVSKEPTITIGSSFGSFHTQAHHITGSGQYKDFNYYIGFTRDLSSEGFRDNSEYRESKLLVNAGYDFSEYSGISFSYNYVNNSFNAPGALTREELRESRTQAPFNSVDGGEADLDIFSTTYHVNFLENFDLSLNAFIRETEDELLTTGRSGSGFFLDSESSSPGFTAQLQNDDEFWGHRNILTVGFEYTENDFTDKGFLTDALGDNPIAFNETDTNEDVFGIFVEDSVNITDALVLTAGVRYDENEFDFEDEFDPTLSGDKQFNEVSPKVGLTYNFDDELSVYGTYSEGFLSPNVQQLFALGMFGSNPDLDPAVSKNFEVGVRKEFGDWLSTQINVFTMDIDDEILFDPSAGIFGSNVNSDTKREGVELSATGSIGERISWFANYTYIDATFESGLNNNETIPLVPENRFSAGVDIQLSEHFTFYFDGLFVDDQVFDGDEANEFDELGDYTIFNAKLTFELGDFTAYVAGENIFDRDYSSRGIIGFGGSGPFFTPAPPASVTVGASYIF
jgi:iron complex outermembrane receptor protein